MVLKNPFVLVTIPLALVLSLIWFRRKKIHCDSGGEKEATKTSENNLNTNNLESNSANASQSQPDLKHSISLPIGSTPKKLSSLALNNNDSFDFKFGKSAPIDITPHKTSPSRSKNGSNASDEKDKNEVLNSIEENSLDSVDLPGSVTCRRRFSFTIRTNEPAVVVKASTMDVNKSPQSSFETLTESPPSNASVIKSTASAKTTPSPNKAKSTEKKSKADKHSVASDADAKKPTRALPAASPPLSLCSNKSNQSHDSGDSGKGSSPANSEGGQLSSIQQYDFELAQGLVGFLVGKNGATVRKIRDDCNVIIYINRHPVKPKKYKLCTIQGTQKQIDKALAMVKAKMPPKTDLGRIDIDTETAEMLAAISKIDSSRLQVGLSLSTPIIPHENLLLPLDAFCDNCE